MFVVLRRANWWGSARSGAPRQSNPDGSPLPTPGAGGVQESALGLDEGFHDGQPQLHQLLAGQHQLRMGGQVGVDKPRGMIRYGQRQQQIT